MSGRRPLDLSSKELAALTVLARRPKGLTQTGWEAFGVTNSVIRSLLKKGLVTTDGDRDLPTFEATQSGIDALPL